MSKSVELLASSEDAETANDKSSGDETSRLNRNGSRQLSRSATELRDRSRKSGGESSSAGRSPEHRRVRATTSSSGGGGGGEGVIQRLRHQHRHISVAQRTHTFFATLKSHWVKSRTKERKKSKDLLDSKSGNQESDYAADYSSEHSRSSSATQSPARHYLNHPESPLARTSRVNEKVVTLQDDSSGRCSDGSPKAQRGPVPVASTMCASTSTGDAGFESEQQQPVSTNQQQNLNQTDGDTEQQQQQSAGAVQDEGLRRRELALRQHAFFQLRLHLRRGANLVAMDRCGASDPYVKIKCSGRLLHKSRTVHRDLNPVWDESITLPIEDPFQPLNFKVFDYDWGLQDDFMGAAQLDLTQLELGQSQDITLELKDPARPRQHLGEIFISTTLWPRNQQEKEQVSASVLRECDDDDDDNDVIGSPVRLGDKVGCSLSTSSLALTKDSSSINSTAAAAAGGAAGAVVVVDAATCTNDVESCNSRSSSPDFFDRIKENFKDKIEDIHRYFQRSSRLADVNRKLKSQIWSSVVTIVLVEAKNLLPMDIDGLSDPYVKFRLGTEKYKSKVANKTLNPVWLEQFDLHLYEDPYLGQELEVTVWDRDRSHQDDLMGRVLIDLATLERETTHRLWRDLEDGAGSIFLLLTISGTTASETISDLAAHEETPHERLQLIQRYAFGNTLQRIRDVGHLTVKVYRAQGLAAADLGGKSDPFCVLELVNSRLQTQTEYKTLAPNWQKIFTFNVKDINSVLEVTVYDEDRDHKVEFLGKIAIPLLKIRNGEKRWYALKDKKLRCRAKGNGPQILLELTVVWNMLRACMRTINPKEKKYMEPEIKFKRQVFLRNVMRLKAIIVIFIDLSKYIQSCWEWESKLRSIIALVLFVVGVYYFEPYMIPTAALLILLKYYAVAVLTGSPLPHQMTVHIQESIDGTSDDGPTTPGDDDDNDDDKEEKKSLKERLQAIQEVTQIVQNSIGYIASLCERVKNLFNFTVPYLSYLAMFIALCASIIFYFIPVRYLILGWGVNKFARKIIRPHSVPNNELLDLVSRVPDDEELLNYRELKPVPTADCESLAGGVGVGGTGATTGSTTTSRREMRRRQKTGA